MSKIRHVKRFDNGNSTPQEYHQKYAFGPHHRCLTCGGRPVIRAITMAPMDEVVKRGLLPGGALLSPEIMKCVVPLKDSAGKPDPHIRLGVAFSCKACQPAFERTLAKLPSWMVVDINRGPDPTNRVTVGAGS